MWRSGLFIRSPPAVATSSFYTFTIVPDIQLIDDAASTAPDHGSSTRPRKASRNLGGVRSLEKAIFHAGVTPGLPMIKVPAPDHFLG
jgi:hypothetical protein